MDVLTRNVNKKTVARAGAAISSVSVLGFYLWCRSQTKNVLSDFKDTVFLLSFRRMLVNIEKNPKWTVVDMFNDTLKANPNQAALTFIEEDGSVITYTFKQLDEASNKVGNWALKEGIKQGEVVALVMDNRPEFIATWLGLAKVGAIIALINTNLTGGPLVYSLDISKAERFIVGIEHADKAVHGMENLPGKKWFISGGELANTTTIDQLLTDSSAISPSKRNTRGPNSDLLYIYTSGTTGNPKAGVIKNIRFYMAGMVFARSFAVTNKDKVYCSLPLYHSAGGMIGVGMNWYSGATLVFRRKFSSKRFWQDIHEHQCTVFQYIGELCRYLLNQPPSDFDHSNVRVAIGNGLRPDIWNKFQTRFNIQQIGEFYAATEGNASVMNTKNKEGAVGYIPPLITKFYPLTIIKLEEDNETPVRQKNGLCVECNFGEKGELLGKIDASDPSRKFDGYTNAKATEKKILRDVLKKGDEYFRSGDLLKRDAQGFYYFVDRLGDTFRWKGENVATSEVESVISTVPGVTLVNVYGVLVPHHDGRAGMAALIVEDNFEFDVLYDTITKNLPSYARPLFLRMMSGMETTSTHKLQKVEARKEGFDPSLVKDDLYFRDDKAGAFVKIDTTMFQKFQEGTLEARL